MKEITCQGCNSQFITKWSTWHERNGRKKYCSRQCSDLAHRTKIRTTCQVCGVELMVHKYRENTVKYCSKKCGVNGSIGPRGFWIGKKRPELIKTNSARTMFKPGSMTGSKSPFWRDNATEKNWSFRHKWVYQEWRKSVLKRDKNQCVQCGSRDNLNVDHIIPFSIDKNSRLDINNGRVLCRPCHIETDTWGGRASKWKAGDAYVQI